MLPDTAKSDPANALSDRAVSSPPARAGELSSPILGWLRSESLLLSVLLGAFLARLLVADRNSYWLDEVYSVTIHGTWNESLTDLVRVLAESTVYPPLYFVTLFEWMNWFGTSEASTRLLSNVFVTLAALFLYLLLRFAFSRRIALTSVVAFSLMYTPMYYGLETRPYAQNIFLVTLSSYFLLRLLQTANGRGWRRAIVSPTGSTFCVVNAALLLTHYYNVFFWVAQGVAVCLFVLLDLSPKRWLRGLGVGAALYGLQAAIFLGVWGRAALDAVDRQDDANLISGAADLPNPVSVLLNSVVSPNVDPPLIIAWVAVILAMGVAAGAFVALFRSAAASVERLRAWMTVYLVIWLTLPFGVAYGAFLTAGVARFSGRYFVFSVVPLAPLIVLTIEAATRFVGQLLKRLRSVHRFVSYSQRRWAVILGVVVLVGLILPGTFDAVRASKADWRGTAGDVVDIVEANQHASYVIYETSFRSEPILDYYLARYSDDIRVTGTIARFEERRGGPFGFEENRDAIEEHDFLIVPFIHHRIGNFPRALDRLRQMYDVHHWQIDGNGKGIAIFSVSAGS